jgi:hypothetical protein
MPTKRRLEITRNFERLTGISPIDHYGDEHLSPEELSNRKMKDRQFTERMRNNTEGEILGYFKWDEETNDMKFYSNDEES